MAVPKWSSWSTPPPPPDPAVPPPIDWGLPIELPTEVLQRLFACGRHPPRHRAPRRRPPRPRTTRPGTLHPPGQPGPTPHPVCPLPPPAPSPAAPPATTYANSTTSTGGNTAEPPTSTTSSRLCIPHHHAVHDRHWQLTLTPNRQLTITYPDGTTNRTGPPRRHPHRQALAPNSPVTVPHPAGLVIPLRT